MTTIATIPTLIDESLELAEILRPTWPASLAALERSGVPLMAKKDDEDEDDDDDKVEISKSELDDLKESVARKDRELRDQKKEAAKVETRMEELEQKLEDAAAGDDAKAKLEKRLERLEAKAEAAEERATKAEAKLETSGRERTAIDVATRLGFRSPARAIKLVDSDDLDSEASAERALEKLAKEEPYLVERKRQRGVGGDDDPDKGGGGSDDDPPAGGSGGNGNGSGGDEPTGQDRIRSHYETEAKKREREAAAAD